MAKSPLNGSGKRKLASWVDAFISHTDNLDAPGLFRKWSAISTIAQVMEQKLWLTTSSPVYANMYVFLVGHPGTGKTRTIRASRAYTEEIADFHRAPVSFTFPSLVDALVRAKRTIVRPPAEPMEYNTITISADELGTFMHKFDKEMADGLSALYDPDPYGHERRGNEIRIKLKSPQVNILCGSTPSNLVETLPEGAWGQGLTSRVIMVFSDERIVGDDFEKVTRKLNADLVHDLKIINSLSGEFTVSQDYRSAVNNWRKLGEPPLPGHPKLIHYNSRRKVHLYKLSMVACVERGNTLILSKDDFNRAMGWLLEAEQAMTEIFQAGAQGADGKAMDEIMHLIRMADISGKGVPETKIVNFARERVPAHTVMRLIEVMERSGMIYAMEPKTAMEAASGVRRFRVASDVKAATA